MRVTMDVGPDGAVSVEVVATPTIGEERPRSADDDQGLLGAPRLLLSEWVPEMPVIRRGEALGVPCGRSKRTSHKKRKWPREAQKFTKG